jgi:hypothetical protein
VISNLNAFAGALTWATDGISKTHLGPDGKPEMLDSAKDSTWAWLKSVIAPTANATALPSNAAGRNFLGRDPRSPQAGTLAYTPPSAPVSVSVSAPLSGTATVNVVNNVNVMGLVETILSKVKGEIEGAFKSLGSAGTNSDSGFDGREHPAMPDHFHGGGH